MDSPHILGTSNTSLALHAFKRTTSNKEIHLGPAQKQETWHWAQEISHNTVLHFDGHDNEGQEGSSVYRLSPQKPWEHVCAQQDTSSKTPPSGAKNVPYCSVSTAMTTSRQGDKVTLLLVPYERTNRGRHLRPQEMSRRGRQISHNAPFRRS